MTTSAHKYAVIAGGAAICLAVAGCGSGSGHATTGRAPAQPSGNAVLAAYTSTLSAKTARVTFDDDVSAAGRSENLTGHGVVDFNDRQGELTFSAPKVGTFEEIIDDPELYIRLPAADRSQIPGHKPWVSLNIEKITKAKLGASLSELSSSAQGPTQTLGYLDAVSNGVDKVGTPTFDGVATTEYAADVSLTKAAATKSPQVQAAVKKIEAELHSTALPVKVWIDGQHRLRQIVYQLSTTSGTTRVSQTVTMGLSDFGLPVHVTAPPAAQTFDATGKALAAGTSTS